MQLGELIAFLETQDPTTRVPMGFDTPHSYRGYYDSLAFQPMENTTVGDMLDCAQGALDKTFEGYKGGEYVMDQYTDVYLAMYGCCGEALGPVLLGYMVGGVW